MGARGFFWYDTNLSEFDSADIITSRVSGRGYRIGAMFLCVYVCVCLSVSTLTAEPFDTTLIFGMVVDLDLS